MNYSKKQLIEIIKSIISTCKEQNGWVKMSEVGIRLTREDISPKDYSFYKLKPFLESLEILDIENDPNTNLPLVKLKVDKENAFRLSENHKEGHLTRWANINQKEAVESLRLLALPERWSFSNNDDNYPSPILAKYLKWTFVKLNREGKIKYSNNYAAFNTGLVDKFYKPIYAIFEKNRLNMQPWFFVDFCVAGAKTKAARILSDNFTDLPERAIYIQKYDDVMYDCSLEVDVSWEHIVLDNIERIPLKFLKLVSPNCESSLIDSLVDSNRKAYYGKLRESLNNDPMRLGMITGLMGMALDNAKLRVSWNYKTTIPVYYPTDDKVHLILPLSLNPQEPDEISLALVMTKTPAGRYRAVTIFTLDMAYSNARLVTKPSSDWLVADNIKSDISFNNI